MVSISIMALEMRAISRRSSRLKTSPVNFSPRVRHKMAVFCGPVMAAMAA